jgi:hypothetical protein
MLIIILSACSPSPQTIQTAIAQTQAAIPTNTPISTPTLTPTISCTNKGWNDIDIYLIQYRRQDDSYVIGSDKNAYLESLTNIKNQVNETYVDACTENARQLLVTGLEKRIYANDLLLTGGSAEDAISAVEIGNAMIDDAIAELRKMGIYVNRPY